MTNNYFDLIEEKIINGKDFGSAAWVIETKELIRKIARDQRDECKKAVRILQTEKYEEIDNCDEHNCPLCALDRAIEAIHMINREE